MFTKYLCFILVGISLSLPTVSSANSFPCNQGNVCPTQTQTATPALPVEKLDSPTNKLLSLTDVIQNLDLSEEQTLVLYHVVQKQMPEVSQNLMRLKNAQDVLNNMAVYKDFDEKLAKALVQTIADNTANLAILQAERDYQMLAMLTPEQVKRFQELKSNTDNN
jgi:Spy/CpxP family protein refolding chaperone